jgi:MFS family permease
MFNNHFKNLNLTFVVVIIAALTGYGFLLLKVSSNYLPVWSDEFFYYTNSFSFFKNNTLQAALTFSGSGSSVLGADAHGFAYPLLNGVIAKIFGWSNTNFIYTNFFFVAVSLLLIWLQKNITNGQKVLVTAAVLLFPFFILYGFTYMQECVQMFFAITCSILVYKIYKEDKRKHYALFLVTIIVAAFFRPLWLFWLVALVPFAKNKFEKKIFLSLFFIGAIAAFAIATFFAEAVPNYFASVINLLKQGDVKHAVSSMAFHFTYNVYAYFIKSHDTIIYIPIKYFILMVLIFFVAQAVKNKSKLFSAIALVGTVNFAMLFLFYDVFLWREIRILAPFFYFSIPIVIIETKGVFKYVQLFILALLFIFILPLAYNWVQGRNIYTAQEIEKSKLAYSEIAQKVTGNRTVLINFTPSDSTLILIQLPVKNIADSAIRYIVPYYRAKKIKYDYILNEPNTPVSGKIVISNPYYQLERNY